MADVTVGGVTYPVYASLEDANEYLAASLFAVKWSGGDTNFKSKVMVMATRHLDAIAWKGTKVDDAQPIEWPRSGTGVPPDDGTTPTAILNGFFEMCALIAEDPSVIQSANSGSNVMRAKGGEAEVWFFKSTFESATRLPAIVHNWVRNYFASEGGSYSLATGVDDCLDSVFDEPPNRIGGLY